MAISANFSRLSDKLVIGQQETGKVPWRNPNASEARALWQMFLPTKATLRILFLSRLQ